MPDPSVLLNICLLGLLAFNSISESTTDWDSVQFATSGTSLKFFDYRSGTVYLYSDVDGKIYDTWVMRRLGSDMEKE